MPRPTHATLTAPVTLYLPAGHGGPFPFEVMQDSDRVGTFSDRDEALRFALQLARSIHHYNGVDVRLRVEDEDGSWTSVDAF